MKPLELLRAAYGTVELLAPSAVESMLVGRVADSRARTVIRILGARHVLQAAATARGGPGLHRLGGGVDLIHAVTMIALAVSDPRRRRAAVVNAAIALAFAAGELR